MGKYKAKLTVYGEDNEHRVWEVESEEDNVKKTVVFSYDGKDRQRVCFYIDHIVGHAVIIDNGEWDLICFDIEYTPNDIRVACDHFLTFIKENHEVVPILSTTYEFKDYDDMMEVMC